MRTLTLALFCLTAVLAIAGCKSGHDDDHTNHNMTSPLVLPR